MRGVYKICRARKEHQCTECRCRRIEPGQLYLRADAPPEHEIVGNGKRWQVIRACLRCADYYGLHSSETRTQVEAMGL